MPLAPGTLTADEQRRLLDVTAGDDSFRDHLILSVALGTGLRLHELLALNVGDIAFPDGTPRSRVRLRVAKGGRTADIFLPRRLRVKLRRFLIWKRRGGESLTAGAPLFASKNCRRLSKRRTQQIFATWQRRAGLDQHHTFHRLRHTAVHQVYRTTKDILITQRFARHSSLLVTAVYLHPSDDDLAGSVREIIC